MMYWKTLVLINYSLHFFKQKMFCTNLEFNLDTLSEPTFSGCFEQKWIQNK